jgi:hypothetical protein
MCVCKKKIPPQIDVGVGLFQSQTTCLYFSHKNNQAQYNDCLKRCPKLDDDPLNNVEINLMSFKEDPL